MPVAKLILRLLHAILLSMGSQYPAILRSSLVILGGALRPITLMKETNEKVEAGVTIRQ
jgi:hypothetical protein